MERKKTSEMDPLPILEKIGEWDGYSLDAAYRHVTDRLKEDMRPIKDAESSGVEFCYVRPWNAVPYMEINASPLAHEKDLRENIFGETIEVAHVSVHIRLSPGREEFRYTSARRITEKPGRVSADPIATEMQFDIAKHPETLFYPFIYFVANSPGIRDGEKSVVASRLAESSGIAIDAVDVECPEDRPDLAEWFSKVGATLTSPSNLPDVLDRIMAGRLYVVYGEFDPATRRNLAPGPKEENEDEDEY